jgi:pyruvate, water dikinase
VPTRSSTATRVARSPHAAHERDRPHVLWLDDIDAADSALVGGKASSLGELRRSLAGAGVRVPNGFVTTDRAYSAYLRSELPAEVTREVPELQGLVSRDGDAAPTLGEALEALFAEGPGDDALAGHDVSAHARHLCLATPVPSDVRAALADAYEELCAEYGELVDVAVRSSATGEDSATASFAGQYESFLAVRGIDGVVETWRRCAASAFTDRVVSYQLQQGMDPIAASLSVVVMKMVRADRASSGVIFTLDPDSGNDNVVFVTSSYGLGEPVVQGSVSPDTFLVWKGGVGRVADPVIHRRLGEKAQKMIYADDDAAPRVVDVDASERAGWSIAPSEVAELARQALAVEQHYGRPMDIEWAKDGPAGDLFLVQARPETVHAQRAPGSAREVHTMDHALVAELRSNGDLRATGQAVGSRIAAGPVRRYRTYEEVLEKERALRARAEAGSTPEDLDPRDRVFEPGDVLVTEMTTPDWEPLMRKASLIVTEKGGRTSHAAIVAREFGIPAIVGCGEEARILHPHEIVTGSCAEGETGYVFAGRHPFEVRHVAVESAELDTAIKLNVGFPDKALHDAMLPSDGVGLARLEFILTSEVGVHPLVLAHFGALRRFAETGVLGEELAPFAERLHEAGPSRVTELLDDVDRRAPTGADPRALFVDRVRMGVAKICAAFHPRPVLVRLSDLKSNEYRALLGGDLFEPEEENPMIAWRGAARYADERFRPAFEMECEALRRVRVDAGLDNLQVMVPFCRTPEEGGAVTRLLHDRGLGPDDGVPLFLMVELPSNVIDADSFIDEMGLHGGSIGTNDLVQTVYALSRDDMSAYGAHVDARSPAVRWMIRRAIERFQARGLEIGMCGQAPSDYPDEIPPFLVECGITSISVTPDTLFDVREAVRRAERGEAGRE